MKMTKRDQILIAVIGVIAIVGGFYWFVVKPAKADLGTQKDTLSAVQNETNDLRDTLDRMAATDKGESQRTVDWVQSAAMLVRREAAAEIGFFDPQFFVYSDEVDFCRRLAVAGWRTLYVPGARAVHHEQLSTGNVPTRRIVEFSRNRDRYMRKHHSAASAALVRYLTAYAYALRTAGAFVLPGHDPKRYAKHVSATLRPDRGEGLAEGAEEFNRQLKGPRA